MEYFLDSPLNIRSFSCYVFTFGFISDNQYQVDTDIENVSGKLESFSLSDAIETSLNMQGMHAPLEEHRPRGNFKSVEVVTSFGILFPIFLRQKIPTNCSFGVRLQCCSQRDGKNGLWTSIRRRTS